MKIYKYFSSDVLELVFARDGFCGVKCSLPKDYNDPFELFLGVDPSVDTECLATFQEIVSEVPQLPTTCFSKSPIISPMWAHYGQNHSGFVLEFDVDYLKQEFDELRLDEVTYRDSPDTRVEESLLRATATRKPRHAIWLTQLVMSVAYFSKFTQWNYEQEFRLVSPKEYIENIGGNEILFLPSASISSMIVGQNFPEDKTKIASDIAISHELDLYELHIGRSYPRPFMRDTSENPVVFENGEIAPADYACFSCSEPTLSAVEECAWCSITEEHEQEAAQGNMFRAMERLGTLGDYMDGIRDIQKRRRN